jgi:DUF1680 family protein
MALTGLDSTAIGPWSITCRGTPRGCPRTLGTLLGEARFFDQAEQTVFNHLLAAQSPDGKGWNYFTGLRDAKRYRWHYDPDCCPQRGSRAVANLPLFVYGTSDDAVVANVFTPGTVTAQVGRGGAATEVRLDVATEYPTDGRVAITVRPERDGAEFGLRLRKPAWCRRYTLAVNGAAVRATPDDSGYLEVRRAWRGGDRVDLALEMPVRVVTDARNYPNRVAIVRGPLVYAADTSLLPKGVNLDGLVLALDAEEPTRDMRVVATPDGVAGPAIEVPVVRQQPAMGEAVRHERSLYRDLQGPGTGTVGADRAAGEVERVRLVPFYDAGNRGKGIYWDTGRFSPHTTWVMDISYQVWLPYVWR